MLNYGDKNIMNILPTSLTCQCVNRVRDTHDAGSSYHKSRPQDIWGLIPCSPNIKIGWNWKHFQVDVRKMGIIFGMK